jgi:hypothetical protein
VRCERVADDLPGLVDGEALAPPARRHVQRCLRCQAAVGRDRRVHRALEGLADRPLVPPAGLLEDVLAALDEAGPVEATHGRGHRRAAYLGTIAAATAAGVGGAIVLAARGRRLAG